MSKDLISRLNAGPVICAEGYLFAMERRGYLQAGAFVPEVVLEHPEVVTQLHREFIRSGSDVVQAFTYYGHREKLNGSDLANAMSVDENDFIEKFLDKVVSEQPNMIAVQDNEKNNVGVISAKRLSEILAK